MLKLKAQTWSEVEIFYEDVPLTPHDLRDVGWLKAGVARAHWGRTSLRLSIGPYVGRLVVPGRCVIDIHELVPGTVAALLPLCYAGLRWFREPAAAGPVRIEPWAALLEPYGDALRGYTRRGLERRYVPQQWDTQFPRGRIDLGRTLVAHRSRGRPDLVACDVRYLTDDTPINRLLLSAAVRAEAALGIGGHELALRRLREAIAGLRGVSWSLAPDIAAARRDLISRRDDALLLLVELAEMIVSGVGLVAEETDVGDQPVSVWLNVEHIFERAVLRLVRELSTGEVRSGVGDGVKLLVHGEDLDADPDIVVAHPRGTAVLDAKYRRHGSDASREEIYQLIAHANAYSAAFAALVTPRISPSDSHRYLGVDPAGRRFDVLAVDATHPADIVDTLADWLSENGLS